MDKEEEPIDFPYSGVCAFVIIIWNLFILDVQSKRL